MLAILLLYQPSLDGNVFGGGRIEVMKRCEFCFGIDRAD